MRFLAAEVKTLDTGDPFGSFEAIASAPTVDRDDEIVSAAAFSPLPPSIPVHFGHNMSDPVGRAVPEYRGKVLYVRGRFSATQRAQEVRQMVTDGTLQHTSIGFLVNKTSRDGDGRRVITKGELLEVSFVSVSSNREARVLAAKGSRSGMTPAEAKALATRALVDVALADLEEAERFLDRLRGPIGRQVSDFLRSVR